MQTQSTQQTNKSQPKNKRYDEDIPVCVCGKPFIIKMVSECYDGSGVGCDECGENIAKTDKVYHCPADKKNVLHTNGYDVCIPCYKKLSDQVNTDNILFQIWFIINDLNKELYHSLTSKHQVHTRKALVSKSSFELFEYLISIDWNSFHDGTTMKLFCDQYDKLKEKRSSIKDTCYKYRGNMTQQPQQSQQQSWRGWGNNNNNNNNSRFACNMNNNNNASAFFGSSFGSSSNVAACANSWSFGASTSSAPRSQSAFLSAANSAPRMESVDRNIGFSVGGGAKDINSFRLNIEKHQIPSINAISYQGCFNDYYFNTNPMKEEQQTLIEMDIEGVRDDDAKQEELPAFYPSYSSAKTLVPKSLLRIKKHNDMIEGDEHDFCQTQYEYYLTVGLNSNIKERDFKRKKLNLCIVLDISGSMGSSFVGNSFGFGFDYEKSKMRVANECLLLLLTHLNADDRFGLVLFNSNAEVRINMDYMKNMNMEQIEQILEIRPGGGTNFEHGYKEGINMYKNIENNNEYENRLILLTDAHPNEGSTSSESLLHLVSSAANKYNNKIYTTFVGIGVDFNTNLISKIVDVRGANQFSVHTNKEFKKKLHEEFDYFVSPMVFNLRLSLFCEGSNAGAIDEVFGSDNVDIQNGEIMKIKTLFPSPPNEEGDVKGGIILIKLKQENIMNKLPYFCSVTFEDKFGAVIQNKQKIFLAQNYKNEFYPNLGVRKGILLVRYVSLIKDWIQNGMMNPMKYKAMFNEFKIYFRNEIKYINDDTLDKEVKILNRLINW